MDLRQELFKNQDLGYRDFQSGLIPSIDCSSIIGVRIPVLRRIAKRAFLENADNACEYYEEKIVRGFCIGMKKCSLDEHINDIRQFVGLIDNWAVCDLCAAAFKFTRDYQEEMLGLFLSYIGQKEYETRFAVVMLMTYYLDDEHIDMVLDALSSIKSEYYYVNMAVAWAIASAFCKYTDKVTALLEARVFSADVQNKAIQKIRESLKATPQQKAYVATLRIAGE